MGSVPEVASEAGAAGELSGEGVEDAALGAHETAGAGITGVRGGESYTRIEVYVCICHSMGSSDAWEKIDE